MWVERADGANYAPLMVRDPVSIDGTQNAPRDIFQTEGFTDSYTPNVSIEAFATALGSDLVRLPAAATVEGVRLRGRTILVPPFADNTMSRAGVPATLALAQFNQAASSDGHFVVFDLTSAKYPDPVATPAQPNRRQALYDAYCAVPDHQRAEIVDGTLYVSPRPAPRHANALSVLGGELNGAFQRGRGGPGGWWILHEPELVLVPLEPIAPDLAGWRVERMPALPETAYFELPPDWICEVLSRSTESVDRTKKLPLFAAAGVPHVWLVDPIARSLEVHTLGDNGRWRDVRIYEGNARVRAEPFTAIELDLSGLWSGPAQP